MRSIGTVHFSVEARIRNMSQALLLPVSTLKNKSAIHVRVVPSFQQPTFQTMFETNVLIDVS